MAAGITFNGKADWYTGGSSDRLGGQLRTSSLTDVFSPFGSDTSFFWTVDQPYATAVSKDGSSTASVAGPDLSASMAYRFSSKGVAPLEGEYQQTGVFALPYAEAGVGSYGGWYNGTLNYVQDSETGRLIKQDMGIVANEHDFVLAAHSSVTFTGTLEVSMDVSIGDVNPFNLATPVFGADISTMAAALAGIQVGYSDALVEMANEYDDYAALTAAAKAAYGVEEASIELSTADGGTGGKLSRTFSITFANHGDMAVKGSLQLSAATSSLITTQVPEPSAGILSVLGLLAVAAARLRRPAADQA